MPFGYGQPYQYNPYPYGYPPPNPQYPQYLPSAMHVYPPVPGYPPIPGFNPYMLVPPPPPPQQAPPAPVYPQAGTGQNPGYNPNSLPNQPQQPAPGQGTGPSSNYPPGGSSVINHSLKVNKEYNEDGHHATSA